VSFPHYVQLGNMVKHHKCLCVTEPPGLCGQKCNDNVFCDGRIMDFAHPVFSYNGGCLNDVSSRVVGAGIIYVMPMMFYQRYKCINFVRLLRACENVLPGGSLFYLCKKSRVGIVTHSGGCPIYDYLISSGVHQLKSNDLVGSFIYIVLSAGIVSRLGFDPELISIIYLARCPEKVSCFVEACNYAWGGWRRGIVHNNDYSFRFSTFAGWVPVPMLGKLDDRGIEFVFGEKRIISPLSRFEAGIEGAGRKPMFYYGGNCLTEDSLSVGVLTKNSEFSFSFDAFSLYGCSHIVVARLAVAVVVVSGIIPNDVYCRGICADLPIRDFDGYGKVLTQYAKDISRCEDVFRDLKMSLCLEYLNHGTVVVDVCHDVIREKGVLDQLVIENRCCDYVLQNDDCHFSGIFSWERESDGLLGFLSDLVSRMDDEGVIVSCTLDHARLMCYARNGRFYVGNVWFGIQIDVESYLACQNGMYGLEYTVWLGSRIRKGITCARALVHDACTVKGLVVLKDCNLLSYCWSDSPLEGNYRVSGQLMFVLSNYRVVVAKKMKCVGVGNDLFDVGHAALLCGCFSGQTVMVSSCSFPIVKPGQLANFLTQEFEVYGGNSLIRRMVFWWSSEESGDFLKIGWRKSTHRYKGEKTDAEDLVVLPFEGSSRDITSLLEIAKRGVELFLSMYDRIATDDGVVLKPKWLIDGGHESE